MQMLNDLTVGKPARVIFGFSLPLLLSTALQQVYNIADSVIVGRLTGSLGLAAIGAAYPITLFFVAVATGASMGCSVVISQLFGARELTRMKSAVYTALLALTVLGVVLAAAGAVLAGPLMELLNASGELLHDASLYLRIYALGVFPMMVFNAATAIFTGLGDSRRPLVFLAISSVLNIVLDYIAVGPWGMGVAGAAWATAFSQAVAAALSVLVMVRRVRAIRTPERAKPFDAAMLGEMSRLALPAMFQQASVALGHTIIQGVVNTFDMAVVAGYEISSKINTVIYSSLNTLGTALSSYIAQCYGAKKFGRIREGFRASFLMCLGVSLLVLLAAQLFPARIIGLFIGAEAGQGVIQVGVSYLRIISPLYLLITVIITVGGLLRGLGHTTAFFLETVTEFAVRVCMCFVLTDLLASYTGVLWAWCCGSTTGCILCALLYRRTMKREVLPHI